MVVGGTDVVAVKVVTGGCFLFALRSDLSLGLFQDFRLLLGLEWLLTISLTLALLAFRWVRIADTAAETAAWKVAASIWRVGVGLMGWSFFLGDMILLHQNKMNLWARMVEPRRSLIAHVKNRSMFSKVRPTSLWCSPSTEWKWVCRMVSRHLSFKPRYRWLVNNMIQPLNETWKCLRS